MSDIFAADYISSKMGTIQAATVSALDDSINNVTSKFNQLESRLNRIDKSNKKFRWINAGKRRR